MSHYAPQPRHYHSSHYQPHYRENQIRKDVGYHHSLTALASIPLLVALSNAGNYFFPDKSIRNDIQKRDARSVTRRNGLNRRSVTKAANKLKDKMVPHQEWLRVQRLDREEKREHARRMQEEANRMKHIRNLAEKEVAQQRLERQMIRAEKEKAFYDIISGSDYIENRKSLEELVNESVIENIPEFELLFNELRQKADTAGGNNARIRGLQLSIQHERDDYRRGKISNEEYKKWTDTYHDEIRKLMVWNNIGFTRPKASDKSALIISNLGIRRRT